MTAKPRDQIAAENYFVIERARPGGNSIAKRVKLDRVRNASLEMAKDLTFKASKEERDAWLIRHDDAGSDNIHPIDMTGPRLRDMTGRQRHEHANEMALAKTKKTK